LLVHLLVHAGLDPAVAVGGMVRSLNSNGGHGVGTYFVAEADESDGSFLKYAPFGAIITNIDNDHLPYWNTLDSLVAGFKKFARLVQSPEHLLWCGDDELLRALKLKGFSYGFEECNDLQIENFRQVGWKNVFDICFEGTEYSEIEIPLIGGHNVLNAAAVFGLGLKIGIPEEGIRNAFAGFKGISRRTEFKGDCRGIAIFDDYAHHPTEIFATSRAIKQAIGQKRLVMAFQPHRYTRTQDCLNEFSSAFERVDILILTDIYSASEIPIAGITNEVLLAKIREKVFNARYIPRPELSSFLANFLERDDVLVTMGAGDITKVGPEVLKLLVVLNKNSWDNFERESSTPGL
jgi:UDP-N-acetylmuramate--alanine ligase